MEKQVIIHNFYDEAHLWKKQELALDMLDYYKYILIGGTKNTGKSRALRWMGLAWLSLLYTKYHIKGIRGGIFCEDYPALEERHISKVRFEFPNWLGKYNEQRHEFIFTEKHGGHALCFRNLDDPSKYESSEWAFIGVDEIQRNPFSTFTALRQRLRWVKPDGTPISDVRFVGSGVPGGELWVINYWIDKIYPPDEKEAKEFYYIPFYPEDNPNYSTEYKKQLESLTPAEQEAYLRGDWHAFDEVMDDRGWVKLITIPEYNNAIIDQPYHVGVKVMAVDPAAGGDNTAIVLRSENLAQVLFNQKLSDTMSLIPLIARLTNENGVSALAIDIVGIGRGVYDRMLELGWQNVYPINFGNKAEDKTRYTNHKAEMFDRAKDWILKGGKLLRDNGFNEMLSIKYKISSERQIAIQSKDDMIKQGIPSPNVADALAMTFYQEQAAINARKEFVEQEYEKEWYGVKDDEYGFVKKLK